MKKSNSPQAKQRQRQKVSRKTIIIICAFSLSCIVIGLTVFFNISHVDQSNATTANLTIVDEQSFTNEKTVEAPVIIPRQVVNKNTVFAKKAKMLPAGQVK